MMVIGKRNEAPSFLDGKKSLNLFSVFPLPTYMYLILCDLHCTSHVASQLTDILLFVTCIVMNVIKLIAWNLTL